MDVDQNHTTWSFSLYVCTHDVDLGIVRSNQGFGLYHITRNMFYRECDLRPLTPLEKEMVVNMDNQKFIDSFNEKARESQLIAERHGWFVTDDPESLAAKIALMHSELSEALEGLRHGNPPSDHIPEFSALEEEFADVIVRIMHVAVALNLRLPEAIIAKDEFNEKRKFKHGGKKF